MSASQEPLWTESQQGLPPASWLRALARALVHEIGYADDAVQETYLLALRAPAAVAPRTRHWYRTVVRNVLYGEFRAARRRASREKRVARSEKTDASGAALLELSELQQAVRAAIATLDEPYRSTIFLSYFEGLTAEQIAQREHVTASAIRMRVLRAHGALRRQLENKFGDGRRLAAVLLLAARWGSETQPVVVPDVADAAVLVRVREGAGNAWIVRARRFAAGAGLVVAVLVIVGTASLRLRMFTMARAPEHVSDTAATTRSRATLEEGIARQEKPPAQEPRDAAVDERATAPSSPVSPVDPIALRVVSADTREPVSGARVFLRPPDMTLQPPVASTVLTGTTGADGVLLVSRRLLRHGFLRVEAAGYGEYRENVRTRRLAAEGYEVCVEPAFEAEVRVALPDGSPGRDIMVRVYDTANSATASATVSTDRDGRALFRWEAFGPVLEVDAEGYALLRADARAPVTELHLSPGAAGRGIVLDPQGLPVAGATLVLSVDSGTPLTCEFCGGCKPRTPLSVTSDVDGRFVTPRLPLAGSCLIGVQHPDHAGQGFPMTFPLGTDCALELQAGLTIGGRVHGSDGKPVSEGTVRVLAVFDGRVTPLGVECTIGEDGSYRLKPVMPWKLVVQVEHPKHAICFEELEPQTAGELNLDIQLRNAHWVRGRVTDTDGSAMAGIVLRWSSPAGQFPIGVEAATDENGAFSFPGAISTLPDEPLLPASRLQKMPDVVWEPSRPLADTPLSWILEVQKPYNLVSSNGVPVERYEGLGSRNRVLVSPGEEALELVLDEGAGEPITRFIFRDVDGRVIRAPTKVSFLSSENWMSPFDLDLCGNPLQFHDPNGIAGTIVWMKCRGYAFRSAFVDEIQDLSKAEFVLHRCRTDPLRVVVRDPSGEVAAQRPIYAGEVIAGRKPFAGIFLGVTDEQGILDSFVLGPGRYRLFANKVAPTLVGNGAGFSGIAILKSWNITVDVPAAGLVVAELVTGMRE